jgi:hypothetical protein
MPSTSIHVFPAPRPLPLAQIIPVEQVQLSYPNSAFAADVAAHGYLYWCNHGERIALGVRGTREYIERIANFCVNRGIIGTGAEIEWCGQIEGKIFAYVVPYSMEKLLAGIEDQFRGEITMSGEVPPLKDHMDDELGEYVLELNEPEIARRAEQRASRFAAEYLCYAPFLQKFKGADDTEEYALGSAAGETIGQDE